MKYIRKITFKYFFKKVLTNEKNCVIIFRSQKATPNIRRSRVVGRARTIGNRVTVKSGSRVRISPSPPKKHRGALVLLYIFLPESTMIWNPRKFKEFARFAVWLYQFKIYIAAKLRFRISPSPPKNSESSSFRNFFIQVADLAYHHRAKCGVYHQGRQVALVYHHALACISSPQAYIINRRLYRFRNDDIQHFVLMICNFYEIDDIQGLRLDVSLKAWYNKLTDK